MASLDPRLKVQLKQHTPIIHFHDHNGATLRATELKPKLDRWLIQLKGGGDKVPEAWKISSPGMKKEDQGALAYKVRIVPSKPIEVRELGQKEAPMYFGDMDSDEAKRTKVFLSLSKAPFNLYFFIPDQDLKQFLQDNLERFFIEHNFGTRQGKGYGSFSLLKESKVVLPGDSYPCFGFQTHSGKKSTDPTDKWKEIQGVIQYYYQRLKSGINFCRRDGEGLYHHSFLKIYYQRKFPGRRWEKRWLKKEVVGLNLQKISDEQDFVRALLGLPYQYTFKPAARRNCNQSKDPESRVYPSADFKIVVQDPKGVIRRISSPLLFKPIIQDDGYVKVYIITKPYDQPLGYPFSFNGQVLKTPPQKLDLDDLIRAYHLDLGNQFTAEDYSGHLSITVKVFQ